MAMAVTTQLRVSYRTNTLPPRKSCTFTYQSWNLSLPNLKSGIRHNRLSIISMALNDNK
ncbi:hypothetical protein RYX36_010499, partial [Vicia faba]